MKGVTVYHALGVQAFHTYDRKIMFCALGMQAFRTYDKDKSNTLELGEIIHMCRSLGNMSYPEACFVQVRV